MRAAVEVVSIFFSFLMWSCLIYSFLLHFSGLLMQERAPCERLQFVFYMKASANGLNLHSGAVLSVLFLHCKLSYLCSAQETYKNTQQVRGLWSALAGTSGWEQILWMNWVLWMGAVSKGWCRSWTMGTWNWWYWHTIFFFRHVGLLTCLSFHS